VRSCKCERARAGAWVRERSPRRAEKEWKRPARVCERGDTSDTPPTHHPKFASPMAKKERASPEMSYFREKSQQRSRASWGGK